MPISKYQKYNLKSKIILFTFFFVVLILALCTLHLNKVHAQPGQSYEGCDLCGWCGLKYADKPKDWENCMKCLFPVRSARLPIPYPPEPTAYKPWALLTPAYYPNLPEVAKSWTVFGCMDAGPGGFVSQVYKIIIALGSGFAFLAILYGGFQVLTAGGDPQKVASGKNTIMGAIFGVLLIVFSIFLLKLIGYEIIKIPGFG